MKNKKYYIIVIIIIGILSFVIPVRTRYIKEEVGGPSPAINYKKANYNIYGIKIWQK